MKFRVAIIFFLICNNVSSQTIELLMPILIEGKYGFVNVKDDELKIPAQFDEAYPFFKNYDLTLVTYKGKPYLINRKGKLLLSAVSIDYTFFKDTVWTNLFFDCEYQQIRDDCMINDEDYFFDIYSPLDEANYLTKVSENYVVSDLKNEFIVNKQGKKISKDYKKIYAYNDANICFKVQNDAGKNGLVSCKGEELLECKYDDIDYVGNNEWKTFIGETTEIVNFETGNIINRTITGDIPNDANYYVSQIALKKHRVYIPKKDSSFLKNGYDYFEYMSDGKFFFMKDTIAGITDINDKQLFLIKIGQSVSHSQEYFKKLSDSLYFVKTGEKWKLFNFDNKCIGEFDCVSIYKSYLRANYLYCAVKSINKVGIMDKNGEIKIPLQYKRIVVNDRNEHLIVQNAKDHTYGWLNEKGELVYDGFTDFYTLPINYMYIKKDNRWIYVSSSGKEYCVD